MGAAAREHVARWSYDTAAAGVVTAAHRAAR
jgi:hypothetical protein